MLKKKLFVTIILVLSILSFSNSAIAWTMHLKRAAIAVANHQAIESQEMFVFIHNKELNLMALDGGEISDWVYQACQRKFYKKNLQYLKKAAEREGFSIDLPQNPPKRFNPGTDTDAPLSVGKKGEKITLNELKKIYHNYQGNIRRDIKLVGLEEPKGYIDTDTDILPNPYQTTDQEFKRCVDYINNEMHGTAYRTKEVAITQFKLNNGEKLTIEEANAYCKDMEYFANKKFKKAEALIKKAASIPDSGVKQKLIAEAQLCDSQSAKYIDRFRQANNKLLERYNLPSLSRDEEGINLAIKRIMELGRGEHTLRDAKRLHRLHNHIMEKLKYETLDILGEVAKVCPEDSIIARKIMAEEISSMPPSKAGYAIKNIENKLGSSFTRDLVADINNVKTASAKVEIKTVKCDFLRVAMIAGSAYFMGKDGVYHSLEKVRPNETYTEFVIDVYKNAFYYGSGFGYAWDKAINDMKIEYERKLKRGENSSVMRDIAVTTIRSGFYFGKDMIEGIMLLPDSIYEMITGAKAAEAKEQMSKEFLASVRAAVRDMKATKKVVKQAKKMGIHKEDMLEFLNCLCRRCGGSMGGSYNPSFKSDIGHGPCKCSGALNIWKTPIPSDRDKMIECFNLTAAANYAKNQKIFEKWHREILKENYKSIKPDVVEVKNYVEQGSFVKAAGSFMRIKDMLEECNHSEFLNVQNSISIGLIKSSKQDVVYGKLGDAVKKVELAKKVKNKSNDIIKKVKLLKIWKKRWNDFRNNKALEISEHIRKGKIITADKELIDVLKKMNNGYLPIAIKDKTFIKLKSQLKQKNQEFVKYKKELLKKIVLLAKQPSPKDVITLIDVSLEKWEYFPSYKKELLQIRTKAKQNLNTAESYKLMGMKCEKKNDKICAVRYYRASLNLQKDEQLRKRYDYLMGIIAVEKKERINKEKAFVQKAYKLWNMKEYNRAINALNKAYNIRKSSKVHRMITNWSKKRDELYKQAYNLLKEGNRLWKKGYMRQAIQKYKQCVAIWPNKELSKYILKAQKIAEKASKKQNGKAIYYYVQFGKSGLYTCRKQGVVVGVKYRDDDTNPDDAIVEIKCQKMGNGVYISYKNRLFIRMNNGTKWNSCPSGYVVTGVVWRSNTNDAAVTSLLCSKVIQSNGFDDRNVEEVQLNHLGTKRHMCKRGFAMKEAYYTDSDTTSDEGVEIIRCVKLYNVR